MELTREDKIKIIIEKGYTCNPETGVVYSPQGKLVKTMAGKKHIYHHICTTYNKKSLVVKSHHFIWYVKYGNIDIEQLDHINGNTLDNRIENLRSVSNRKNQYNRKNTKGYYFDKDVKKYKAVIVIQENQKTKLKYLGHHSTESEAAEAYLMAKKIYHII